MLLIVFIWLVNFKHVNKKKRETLSDKMKRHDMHQSKTNEGMKVQIKHWTESEQKLSINILLSGMAL